MVILAICRINTLDLHALLYATRTLSEWHCMYIQMEWGGLDRHVFIALLLGIPGLMSGWLVGVGAVMLIWRFF